MNELRVSPVKQFVKNNVSKFELANQRGRSKQFNLYDINNNYCGEYLFNSINSSDYLGVAKSMSNTRLFDNKLNPIMQENIYMHKQFVEVENPSTDIKIEAVPNLITTITTTLDYINNKFRTILSESRLQNKLERIGKDDKYFKYSDEFVVYKPIEEKLVYEQKSEVINEGLISDLREQQNRSRLSGQNQSYFSTHPLRPGQRGSKLSMQYPYLYW